MANERDDKKDDATPSDVAALIDQGPRDGEDPKEFARRACAKMLHLRAPQSAVAARVPVCGTTGLTVSRAIWDEAWIAYAKAHGNSASQHARLLREGFYAGELDDLRPGWRPVDQRIAELEAAVARSATGARNGLKCLSHEKEPSEHWRIEFADGSDMIFANFSEFGAFLMQRERGSISVCPECGDLETSMSKYCSREDCPNNATPDRRTTNG